VASNQGGGASIEHGVIVRQWKWPLRIAFWWLVIGGGVWLGVLCVHWYWARDRSPEAPVEYAHSVLQGELERLSGLEPVLFDPLRLANRVSLAIHDTTVDVALILSRALMNWPTSMREKAASDSIRKDADPGGDFVRRQLEEAGTGWHLAVANTGLFAVRTATYLCALPLIALGVLLGVTDGLVARAKRKACAGHESASIYHRAKLGVSFVAILGYVVYLALPEVRQPALLLVPLAAVVALLVRAQCAYYKKYL
jgi:integrating conjugative element membrane protein (TIGR03747 family)